MERLIQRDQLRENVRGANQQPRQQVQPTRPPPQDNQDIEVRTIMGGTSDWGHKPGKEELRLTSKDGSFSTPNEPNQAQGKRTPSL